MYHNTSDNRSRILAQAIEEGKIKNCSYSTPRGYVKRFKTCNGEDEVFVTYWGRQWRLRCVEPDGNAHFVLKGGFVRIADMSKKKEEPLTVSIFQKLEKEVGNYENKPSTDEHPRARIEWLLRNHYDDITFIDPDFDSEEMALLISVGWDPTPE